MLYKCKKIICLSLLALLIQLPSFSRDTDTSSQTGVPVLSGDSNTCSLEYGTDATDIALFTRLVRRKKQTERLISEIVLRRDSVSEVCGLYKDELTDIRAHNVELTLNGERVYKLYKDGILDAGNDILDRVDELSGILFTIDKRMREIEDVKRFKKKKYTTFLREESALRIYKAELLYMLNFWRLARDWYIIEFAEELAKEEAENNNSNSNSSGGVVIPLGINGGSTTDAGGIKRGGGIGSFNPVVK